MLYYTIHLSRIIKTNKMLNVESIEDILLNMNTLI